MPSPELEMIIRALKKKGVTFEDGLTSTEFAGTETRYGFLFPPDLREFLSLELPVSEGFPNRRTGLIQGPRDVMPIAEFLARPADGICFDIERDNFWMQDWGPKPENFREAFQLAREMVKRAPALIPIYQHRFLPAEPSLEGNPVLSVWQTDIIYYGTDLSSYFGKEFDVPLSNRGNGNRSPRRIRFWSDIIEKADVDFVSERGDL